MIQSRVPFLVPPFDSARARAENPSLARALHNADIIPERRRDGAATVIYFRSWLFRAVERSERGERAKFSTLHESWNHRIVVEYFLEVWDIVGRIFFFMRVKGLPRRGLFLSFFLFLGIEVRHFYNILFIGNIFYNNGHH